MGAKNREAYRGAKRGYQGILLTIILMKITLAADPWICWTNILTGHWVFFPTSRSLLHFGFGSQQSLKIFRPNCDAVSAGSCIFEPTAGERWNRLHIIKRDFVHWSSHYHWYMYTFFSHSLLYHPRIWILKFFASYFCSIVCYLLLFPPNNEH